MRYTLDNGKSVTIPDTEIATFMKNLGLTQDEAIQMWLEDHEYLDNEEQNALDEKAKAVKIDHDAQSENARNKPAKPRTVKVSDEKQSLFDDIFANLQEIYSEDAKILKENKLIEVKIGEKTFKVDIIEQRPPKKK